jgi:phage tail-like protein
MARSSATDPMEKFRFLVSWSDSVHDEKTALVRAGFHDIQMPKRTTTKGTYREGNDIDVNQLFPGLSTMEDIVLSRGLVPNPTGDTAIANEMYQWMSAVHKPSAGHSSNDDVRTSDSASNSFRKDVNIQMLDREGKIARQWILYNAFPVNFVSGSDLNASEDGEKSVEQLTLAYEDFQESVPEAVAPVATSPSLPA